ncbi:outer membrane beta-barrel protein [Variibacter gotjawalensis]|nr:outer membrane beta-barrel protein [Variibacter gotjawalensis]NIK45801.1 hypothetical protein [Variibacter gotjawalensis]
MASDVQAQVRLRGTTSATDDDPDQLYQRRPQQRRDGRRQTPPRSPSAGRTGFNSSNVTDPAAIPGASGSTLPPPSQNVPRAVPRRVAPPPSTTADSRPGRRSGIAPQQAGRIGASITPLPPGIATPLIRPRRPQDDADPFAPVGIRAGSFTLRPAFEATTGYDTQPSRFPGGKGAWFYTLAPELVANSNWSRHALDADIRGSYIDYNGQPFLNRPNMEARLRGRIDVTRDTTVNIEARDLLSTDYPNSPDLNPDPNVPSPALSRLPIRNTIGGDLGVVQRFNRFEVGLKGSIDRTTWQDSEFSNGTTASNESRNYNQYGVALRAAYELTPGVKPFAEIAYDKRVRDIEIDPFGFRRSSDGVTGKIGTTFEISRKLTGEVSIGYITRTYKDANLPELRGVIADASLIWSATGLTTVRLTARSTADESAVDGVAGVLRRDYGIQVDHAFRRWLIGTARFGYGEDDYIGQFPLNNTLVTRFDKRYLASIGLTYRVNRSVQIKGELRQEWMRSTYPGVDYTATVALVGLRLQR